MIKNRLSIGLLFFLCGLNFASWATRIPNFKQQLALSDSELGTILMGLPIGSLVSLPLAGYLITKFQSKSICLFAILSYVVILPAFYLIQNPLGLFGVLFTFGMAGDLLNIAMNTQVVSLESQMKKNIMSSFHAIFSLGLMIGAVIGGFFTSSEISLLIHFGIIAGVNLLLTPWSYTYLLLDEYKISSTEVTRKPFFKIGKYLVILSIIAFCGMLCEGAMADWITLYFKQQKSLLLNLPITAGFSIFALAMVIGRLIGDYIANKIGTQKLLISNGLLISMGMTMILSMNVIFINLLGCLIVGLGISTIVPLIYSEAGASKETEPSLALASVSTIAYIGFLLGPVIIGYISHQHGLKWALSIIIVMGFLASMLATLFLKSETKSIYND